MGVKSCLLTKPLLQSCTLPHHLLPLLPFLSLLELLLVVITEKLLLLQPKQLPSLQLPHLSCQPFLLLSKLLILETLSEEGPFTVFAPTNDAFAKIPADTLNGLLADKEALTSVLLRHVVPGAALKARDVPHGTT